MATPAEEAAVIAASTVLVDQVTAASAQVNAAAVAGAVQAWGGFSDWWDDARAAQVARDVAGLAVEGRATVAELFTDYASEASAVVLDQPRLRAAPSATPRVREYRRGADPARVHARPAEVYRRTFAFTADEQEAFDAAIERTVRLVEDDLMLAAREAQQETYDELRVKLYRRVLRPELSQTGPCGLCVVASDQVYTRRDLLPIHGRCKCITLPKREGFDPGTAINRQDLDRIYAAAGDSTRGEDLKKVRVQVNEHGELGQVLTYRGQKFTGPEQLEGPKRTVAQNVADIRRLEDTLATLIDRQKQGEDLSAPAAYVRGQIARRAS